MPISNLEEKFELAWNTLLEFDRKDIIKENSTEEVTAEEDFNDVSMWLYETFHFNQICFVVMIR